MARQVLPIVGYVAGFFLPGGPAVWGAIGTVIGNAVDPQVIRGPKLGEAGIQTSAEGVFRPIVIGKGPVKGNIVDRGNRQVHKHREQQNKGGGPVTETERVTTTFAIRICEGPIGGVPRIWMDEKLVYDVRPGSTILAESAEFAEKFRLYLGDDDQLPDPALEVIHGEGNAHAYPGSAYIVFPDFDLTDFRERIPDFRFEVTNVPVSPYNYLALLHMDEKFTDTSTHLRDEVDPTRWSPGGDLVVQTEPFGERALEVHGITDTARTTYDFASAIGTSPFLISCWVYLDSAKVDVEPDTILGHWYQPGTRSFQLRARRIGTQNLFLQLSDDGTNITSIQGALTFPTDIPVYVAITRDESGTVHIWQDGVHCGSGGFPHALHSNPIGALGENWHIGGFDNAPSSDCLFGWIKELVIIVGSPVYTENFTPPTAPWPGPTQSGGDPVTVGFAVSLLHDRAGQSADKFDVTELTQPMDGIVLADEYTCAEAIRTLMTPFFFDAAEFDAGDGYKIHYVTRGKPVVMTITEDDLIEAPEKSTREDPLERPRVVHLAYANPTIGYAPAKATAKRNSTDVLVVGERAMSIPVVFEDVDEPAQIADKLMKVIWAGVKGEEEFVLPDSFLELVPTDCIGVSLRGQVRRMFIAQAEVNPGQIALRMVNDRQSAYTSNVTGVPVPPPTPPRPSIVGPTIFNAPMDLPALNDSHDRLVWFEAASGQTEAWFGAQVQRKVAPATEFENSARFTLNTIMGDLIDPITAASEHYTDTTNIVRVHLYTDDQIEALTEQQFLSDGGAFALQNADGSWEVLQYRDAIDEGGQVFALSHLARARLNTGAAAKLTGSRFVLLDAVQSVEVPSAWIGADVTARAVSFQMTPDGAEQVTTEWNAKSQTEFPVAHLFGEIVSDTLNLLTIPRHRFGTELNPIRSINWTGYRWSATDGTNSLQQDTLTDTASFDVTGWSSPITVTVAQINRFTGPGPVVTEQFTP